MNRKDHRSQHIQIPGAEFYPRTNSVHHIMFRLTEVSTSPAHTSNKCLCALVDAGGSDLDEDDDDERYALKCPGCVHRSLKPHWNRHAQALQERDRAKAECSRQLQSLPNQNRLGELQAESQQLRERVAMLRKQCGEMAVRVASQAVENDSRREAAQSALSTAGGGDGAPRHQLEQLEQSLLQGSLHHALDVAAKQVRVLRFQWARKALAMHRLDIDPNDVVKLTPYQQLQSNKNGKASIQRRARGIGKIGGLPLPHAGPELYGVLPPKELQSALRLVASVTCTLARCLGIVLPHPILLTPSSGTKGEDITDTVELQRRLRESHHSTTLVHDVPTQPTTTTSFGGASSPASTSSSIMSLMDTSYWKRSAKKALARATGQTKSSSSSSFPSSSNSNANQYQSSTSSQSMDSNQISLRIHHATAAVLVEDGNPSSSKFVLSAEMMHQQDFAIALQLLQNDVVVLCIRAGVPVGQMWPAEAILLNLYQLDQYCQEMTGVAY